MNTTPDGTRLKPSTSADGASALPAAADSAAPVLISGVYRLTRFEIWLLTGLFLLALVVRLPLALSNTFLWPDGIEYLNMAEHLAAGEGFAMSVKAHFIDDTPVVRNGLTIRPPLFPLVLAPLVNLPGWPRSGQVLNVLLAAGNVIFIYLLARRFAVRPVALAAALIAAVSVPMVSTSVQPMTEQLSLWFSLLAFTLATRTDRGSLVSAGAIVGLANLTRPANLLLLAVVGSYIALGQGARRIRFQRGLLVLAGFGLVSAIWAVWSLSSYGRLYFGSSAFLYTVPQDGLIGRGGFRSERAASPIEYVISNPDEVVAGVARKLLEYLPAMFGDPDYAWVLLPGVPLIALVLFRRRLPIAALPLLLAAILNLVVVIGTWAPQFQARYLLAPFVYLLPLCLYGVWDASRLARPFQRARLGVAHAALAAVVVGSAVHTLRDPFGGASRGELPGAVWVGSPRAWSNPDLERLMTWIETQTGRADIVAHEYPWVITYFTHRPTALLPTQLSGSQLERFVRELRVDYVVVDRNDVDRRSYIERFERLGERYAIPETQLGSYRVFRLSELWR